MTEDHSKVSSVLVLGGYLAAACLAALFGTYFTTKVTITAFYADLLKPVWAPPAWLFGPVWSFLYLSMSLAMWLVWRKKGVTPAKAYTAAQRGWWGQLALNALWPLLFWLQPAGLAPFLVCALLAVSIWLCIRWFWPVSIPAALLMLPYAAWVTFASALSWALWRMNSGS